MIPKVVSSRPAPLNKQKRKPKQRNAFHPKHQTAMSTQSDSNNPTFNPAGASAPPTAGADADADAETDADTDADMRYANNVKAQTLDAIYRSPPTSSGGGRRGEMPMVTVSYDRKRQIIRIASSSPAYTRQLERQLSRRKDLTTAAGGREGGRRGLRLEFQSLGPLESSGSPKKRADAAGGRGDGERTWGALFGMSRTRARQGHTSFA